MDGSVLASPLVAVGRVYVCNERGDVVVLDATKDVKVLATHSTGGGIHASPIFANGTLHIGSGDRLLAVGASQ